MVSFVVEDGTGVTGANTYASEDYVLEYGLDRGTDLNSGTTALSAMMLFAMDWLVGKGLGIDDVRFRTGVTTWNGLSVTYVLDRLRRAQAELCREHFAGTDLFPTQTTSHVTEERVGQLMTKYSDTMTTVHGTSPLMPSVSNLIRPLLKVSTSLGSFALSVVRI